jgi:hypothetical protein
VIVFLLLRERNARFLQSFEWAQYNRIFCLQRLHFLQATSMACGSTEVRSQKDLDWFQGERRPDHLSSQAGDFHVVIFNALMVA